MNPSEKVKPPADLYDILGTPERRSTLVTLVTDQIEALIRDRRLREGDQLPNERELCRQFGVSRTVVREAIARLIAKSLLEVRAGSGGGFIVRAPSAAHVSDSLSLLLHMDGSPIQHEKVLEVRRLLEVEIAALAAARRTPADVERLTALLAAHADARDNRERFAELDVEFHKTLAAATQNELFVILLDSLSGVLVSMRRIGYGTPGNPERALRYHRAILAEVSAGNVEGARQAMRAHLIEAEETVRLALGLPGRAGAPHQGEAK